MKLSSRWHVNSWVSGYCKLDPVEVNVLTWNSKEIICSYIYIIVFHFDILEVFQYMLYFLYSDILLSCHNVSIYYTPSVSHLCLLGTLFHLLSTVCVSRFVIWNGSLSWYFLFFHFPFAWLVILLIHLSYVNLNHIPNSFTLLFSSLFPHMLVPVWPFTASFFFPQRRCRNCRSTLLCSGRSMWRCNRSWWKRRGGAPYWPPRPLFQAPPPRPATPSSAACWPLWLTSISRTSTGEL